jgi:3-oxoacyl-[acyl-carrier-protein] synthase-1
MTRNCIYVRAGGFISALGLSVMPTFAAVRAGIKRHKELPYRDNQRERIIGSRVPGLSEHLQGSERLLELIALSIQDLLRQTPLQSMAQVPILIGLPESCSSGALNEASISSALRRRLGTDIAQQGLSIFPWGRTAAFHALAAARAGLSGRLPFALICCADSLIEPRTLLWLEERQLLKTNANPDGVIPGEAGASLLVTRDRLMDDDLAIQGMGFATETAPILTDAPLLGQGLAAAATAALGEAAIAPERIELRVSDAAGDRYGFREHALAWAKTLRLKKAHVPLHLLAESLGDTGAVSGLGQVLLIKHLKERTSRSVLPALCFTSGLAGDRAAMVLASVRTS